MSITAIPLHVSDESSRGSYPLIHPEVFSGVSDILERGRSEGVFPGGVLLVGMHGREVFKKGVGVQSLADGKDGQEYPMSEQSVFDIAALTNVLVTSTLVMKLVESGRLSLTDRVSRHFPGFGVFGKSGVTVEQLLSHSSGLVHWHPFYEELLKANSATRLGILTSRGAKDYILNSINRSQLKYSPGTRQVYSDVGFMLLGFLVEMLSGFNLDRSAWNFIFKPLGMLNTGFIDLTQIKSRGIQPVHEVMAATEACPWRKRVLCGEVHDDNAWAMGGVAGHSGVFTTADDLHRFASEMLRAYNGQSDFVEKDTLRSFWQAENNFRDSGWRLGWDSPSRENDLAHSNLSEAAVGHSGFTGCSLWIEPELGIDIVLMTNRIHPSRSNKKIRNFRPELIDAVLEAAGKLNI